MSDPKAEPTCAPDNILTALAEGDLETAGPWLKHIGTCPDCQARFDARVNGPAGLATTIGAPEPDPGLAADLARFLGRAAAPPPNGVPGFEILEWVGAGGMGVVYRARQAGLNRVVALKMIGGDRVGPKEVIRFLAEAESLASVRHPHVVQVHEFGEAAGRPFLAMEFLPGGTLADRLRGGPLAPSAAAALARALARAVQAAHDQGIVHRDLKPTNVLFDAAGEPRVTDFGLAKRAGGSELTATEAVLGTPAYMSPEQAEGKTKFVGPAADIHALGVILYESLTARRPFAHPDPVGLLRLVAEAHPVPPRALVPAVPKDLDLICRKCLAKAPADRYPTAAALADDLGRFLDGRPILARPLGPAARTWRWARRNPRTAALVGSVAGLLVVVAAGSAAAAVLLKRERDTARQAERDRRQELYKAYVGEARAVRTSGRVGRRVRGLALIRSVLDTIPADELSPDQRAELRDEAIACLALPDVRPVDRRPSHSKLAHDVDSDDHFETFTFLDAERNCTVVRRPGRADVALPALPTDFMVRHSLRQLSPDNRYVAEVVVAALDGKRTTIRVWEVETGRRVFHESFPVDAGTEVAFHPTAPELSLGGQDHVLRQVDLTTGRVRSRALRAGDLRARYSPDGRVLAVTNGVAAPLLLDAGTLAPVEAGPDIREASAVAWAPGGHFLAFGTYSGRVYVWDRGARVGWFLTGAHRGAVHDLRFAPDGRGVASSGTDNQTRLWDIHGHRTSFAVPGRVVRFSPAGDRFAAADDREFVVYEFVGGAEVRTIREGVEGAEFSADGETLALYGVRGARLVAADTFAPVADLGLDDCGGVAFRPDGRAVVTVTRFGGPWVWPIRRTFLGTQVGPPRPLYPEYTPGDPEPRQKGLKPVNDGRHAAWSRDGAVLALPDRRESTVLLADPAGAKMPRVLGPMPEAARVAVSPDGRFVAASASDFQGTRVLGLDGRVQLAVPEHRAVAFSPDGRWFASAGRYEIHLFRVGGAWERAWVVPRDEAEQFGQPALAFQPGTGLLAAVTSRQHVRLIDPDTGTAAATLTHADPEVMSRLSFSPDGTRLAVTRDRVEVAVWDLGRVQVGLADLGLSAAGLPAPAGPPPARPVWIQRGKSIPGPEVATGRWAALGLEEAFLNRNYPAAVMDMTRAIDTAPPDPGYRSGLLASRAQYYWRIGAAGQARADWQAALDLKADNAGAAVGLARVCALGPPELRDPYRALGAIGPVAAPADAPPLAVLLLGVTQTRLDRPRDALATLDRPPARAAGPIREYFRAINLARLGEAAAAAAALAAGNAAAAEKKADPAEEDEVARARADAAAAVAAPRKP